MNDHTTQLPLFTTCPADPSLEIPYGYCQCGCGQKTTIATVTSNWYGWVKGQPKRFIRYHVAQRPIADRFWEKVAKRSPNECWLWQGLTDKDGYGWLSISKKNKRAHRISWRLHNGPIPKNMWVLHRCDTPGCVNPAHLFLGDHTDNMRDRLAKGRQVYGMAKLKESQIPTIRKLAEQGVSCRQIARRFAVHPSTIENVVRRKSWKQVP